MPTSSSSTPEFQPKDAPSGGPQPDATLPVARPFLDHVFHWAAIVPGMFEPGLYPPQVLCACRLRVFRNGSLGRAVEWAVLITELPSPDESYGRPSNPGIPARSCLAEIADLVKGMYLLRAPFEQIHWFIHDRAQTSRSRPLPHDVLQRVQFNVRQAGSKCLYLGFLLTLVAPEELELSAGGMVEL